MKTNDSPVVKDLVLIGGGHAHVSVLRQLAMKPVNGLRTTLITRDIHTPYSGMLPGYLSGFYDYDACHIDLGPLARFAGARLYHNEVNGLDLSNKQVIMPGRPPVSYDLLSINIGSRPTKANITGVDDFAIAVKPIDLFLKRWPQIVAQIEQATGEYHLIIVGAGAAGVELALSAEYRLRQIKRSTPVTISIVTRAATIMPSHNHKVRESIETILKQRGIEVQSNADVVQVNKDSIQTSAGLFSADAVLWVTNASAPTWLAESGLAVDDDGFIRVEDTLQSSSHPDIFAGGDIAALVKPRPKSGVFAVRHGLVLKKNLRKAATGRRLIHYKPQAHFLSLITTGEKFAIASHGNLFLEGKWLWTLKDWIDRRFMRKFNELPVMADDDQPKLAGGIADSAAIKELSTIAMRCGGCGAKVGATVLSRVMERLPSGQRDDVLIGRDAPDDCAMLMVPSGKAMVQSVDYFRAFVDDSYTFGAIAANHALGDVFAMGAEAQSVLAIATVPYGRETIVEQALYEMLAGALSIIEPTGAVLAGGHSSEGAEQAFGLTVNGLVDIKGVWRKGGMQAGDKLILSKAIGTGTLLAADMRHQAKGRWISAAMQTMLLSNQSASECLREFNTSACTDLTGFGIVGHLVEMTRASGVDVQIHIDAIPCLDGALQTVAAGILSSLQPANLRLRRAIANIEQASKHPRYPLLFDPQTAGGLLATVAADQADDCIQALKLRGYADSAIIGEIQAQGDAIEPISIRL